MEWRAHVREEWELQRVRLMLGRSVPAGLEMLMENGAWSVVDPAVTSDGAGVVLPIDAVPGTGVMGSVLAQGQLAV